MRRALVNVATEAYWPYQDRLIAQTREVDPGCALMYFRAIPDSWPSHAERPYAFKSHALLQAARYLPWHNDRELAPTLLLWCDAPIVPVRDMTPLWDQIERDGYWIARNGWNNYEWTADSAYPTIFPRETLDSARTRNKTIPHVVASAFGLNTAHPLGQRLLSRYFNLCNTTAICGPWKNTPETPCGPPDVLGHRHDQTILSLVAWELGLKLTDCPAIFAYAPGAESSILVSDGGWTLSHVLAER